MIRAKERIKTAYTHIYQRHKKKLTYLMLVLSSLVVMMSLHRTVIHRHDQHIRPKQFSTFDLIKPNENETADELYDVIFGMSRAHGEADDFNPDRAGLLVDTKDATNFSHDPLFSMHVTENDIEDISVELPPTLKNYRNPCWLEMVPNDFSYFKETFFYQYYRLYPEHQPPRDWEETYTYMDDLIQARKQLSPDGRGWRVRCFPYFFLIGFTKAGTSDIRRTLSKLPDFVPGIIKEPKFWNKIRFEAVLGADVLPKPTLSDYLDLYDKASEELRHYVNVTHDKTLYHPGIIGDFDPQTIWQLPKWQVIKGNEFKHEPRYITAHHLYGIRPQTKLIVLMRDPVERAFSHYRFFKSRKSGSKIIYADKFHEDMVKAIKKMETCIKEKSVRTCAYFPWKFDPISLRSITVSMYDVYIRDWLHVFPRNQFLFIRSEDYFKDRAAVINELINFLNVDNEIPKSLVNKMAVLRVMNKSTQSGMNNETRALLQDFFRPYNEKLASLLKNNKFLWNS